MSRALVDSGADEATVRTHAAELIGLAARHGVRNLRFASTGRLVGDLDPGRDALDAAGFCGDAEDLLGAEIYLLSSRVAKKPGASPDIARATPL